MKDIRSTFSSDKGFTKYFASQKWTDGIQGRRPNLLSNVAFQYMMGRQFNYSFADALIAAVLGKEVCNVVVLDTIVKTPELLDRPMVLDLLVMLDGQLVNVEIQLLPEIYYDLRCYMQMAALLQDRLHTMYQEMKSAGQAKIRHDTIYGLLPKAININFLGFYVDKNDPHYLWQFKLVDIKRLNRTAVPEIEFIFIELPKFHRMYAGKGLSDLKTPLERWLYFYVNCFDKHTLIDFLNKSEGIFMEYEKQIEDASQQLDFVTRYQNSIFYLIESMIMSPAEERDSYREELEQTRMELAAKDDELAAKDGELAAKDGELAAKDGELAAKLAAKDEEMTAKVNELAAKERELEILRKELENVKGNV